jgi:hypothetical protein
VKIAFNGTIYLNLITKMMNEMILGRIETGKRRFFIYFLMSMSGCHEDSVCKHC